MKLVKIFTLFFSSFTNSQFQNTPLGSQHDEHNCVSDGGYSWCESTSSCVRTWETPCPELVIETHQTEYCQSSSMQLCRMACEEPSCNVNQCAMRQGSCCDYQCQSNYVLGGNTQQIPNNCISWFDGCNTCSVNNGKIGGCTMMMCFQQGTPECRAYDQGHRRLSEHYSSENEICGGFMPARLIKECLPGLECVNTMGPMIADAPGVCKRDCPKLSPSRDMYGNCVEPGCRTWFDGCNNCLVGERGQLGCTEMFCQNPTIAHCNDNLQIQLKLNDICYQFCEDNSQPMINKRNDCPSGTRCFSTQLNQISFDTCGDRSLRCISGN
jgi:hypothetical protein